MANTDQTENTNNTQVPQDLDDNAVYREKVYAALGELGEGSAEEVVNKLESLYPEAPDKLIIAKTHQSLTELHTEDRIRATEVDGKLIYKSGSAK
jgi:hypothetical protein